jgi:hypothetical protein
MAERRRLSPRESREALADLASKKKRGHKYRASPQSVDGIRFDSKAEARRYGELKTLQEAGEVLWFIRQPRFDLPGGTTYKADFLVVHSASVAPGTGKVKVEVTIEDVKGHRTPMYIMKKKQVEALYPIEIEEITY